MREIEMTLRGKILILLPIFLISIGTFVGEPYIAVAASFLFSLLFYSKFQIKNCSLEFEDRVSEGNKTVDEFFKVEHRIRSEKTLEVKISKDLKEEFESVEEDTEKKIQTDSQVSYKIKPKSRGYHTIGKLTGWLYDPLKVYKKSIEHKIELEIVVQSSKEAIKKAKTYSKRSYAKEFVEDPFVFTVSSNEFEGIREFQPGDSLRDIHWKSFSKFQKLMTKIYERISPIGSHILLDCSPSMRRRLSDGTTKLDHSIYVGLQILKNFDLQGHKIGMTAYNHKDVIFHQELDSGKSVFQRMYDKVTDLPGAVKSKNLKTERYETPLEIDEIDEREKDFSDKISQFTSIAGSKSLSGIILSVDQIRTQVKEKRLIIIISDLEMHPLATLKAVEYLKKMKNEVWLIVPFGPWYEVKEVDQKILERSYREYEKLEKILRKMERLGCSIFELYPDKEGVEILEERGEKTI
ncbi:MAG: DUF58 domain-containing protein [Candidatus Thermoplasmatota archaeon]